MKISTMSVSADALNKNSLASFTCCVVGKRVLIPPASRKASRVSWKTIAKPGPTHKRLACSFWVKRIRSNCVPALIHFEPHPALRGRRLKNVGSRKAFLSISHASASSLKIEGPNGQFVLSVNYPSVPPSALLRTHRPVIRG